MVSPDPTIVAWLNAISPFATFAATVVLVWVTAVLARETQRMADAGAQPQVVVSLEPNPWAINHVDMKIANTGNASAFEIKVAFSPPLVGSEAGTRRDLPFQNMSLLRPGQVLASHVSDHATLKDQVFDISVTWSRKPGGKREELKYRFSLSDYSGLALLGGGDPLVQISQDLKKIREDWQRVASGNRKISVSTFSASDREREQAELHAMYDDMVKKDQSHSDPTESGPS